MRISHPDTDGALNLRAGEEVQIRSKTEILASLDAHAKTEALPFMPEMLQHCGKRFTIYKRAHKTCDTIGRTGSRRMANTVHLTGVRCDGSAHGGCQAGCLIFWKEAWLKRVDNGRSSASRIALSEPVDEAAATRFEGTAQTCAEEAIVAATRRDSDPAGGVEVLYVCQATELLKATEPLPWWDFRQYVSDIRSGNIGFLEFARGVAISAFNSGIRAIRLTLVALSHRVSSASPPAAAALSSAADEPPASSSAISRIVQFVKTTTHDVLVEYPHVRGTLRNTPSTVLNLQSGDTATVKRKSEIVATLDTNNKNRGLSFDVEMVPYCGGTYRVLRRVDRILDERTGRIMNLRNCIILDGVACGGCYSTRRLFCPRSIYSYWHEIWLRKAESTSAASPGRNTFQQ